MGSGKGTLRGTTATGVALALLALALAPPAHAKQTHLFIEDFGPAVKQEFGLPGRTGGANGLAVDPASGDLLVIDSLAETVSRFHADGTPSPFAALGTNVIDGKGGGACPAVPADCDQTPEGGLGFDGFAGTQQVAVDSSGTATDGNIYITQGIKGAGRLVDVFSAEGEYLGQITGYLDAEGEERLFSESDTFTACGVAVDGAGDLFVAGGDERRIYKYSPAANPPVNGDNTATFETADWPDPPYEGEEPPPVCNLAAGAGPSAGALFANTFYTFAGNSVVKLNGDSGAFAYVVDEGERRLVSVDAASGSVFAGGDSGGVLEWGAAGPSPIELSESFVGTSYGLAADGARERLYLSQGRRIRVYGPRVTVPDALTGAAEITGDTSLRLNGTVDPDGEPLTECFFEYDTEDYVSDPPGSEVKAVHGQPAPCNPSAAGVGAGRAPVAVSAEIAGLEPETLYHYRLIARNAAAAEYPADPFVSVALGGERTVRTPGKPAIRGAWAQDVLTGEASLRARINPENSPTSYRFQWGLAAGPPYEHETAEVQIGAGEEVRAVSLALADLAPATAYHWRLVATNTIGTTITGDRVFRTFALPAPLPNPDPCPNAALRGGPGAQLPDCRGYEMVSPLDKGGTDLEVRFNLEGNDLPQIHQSSAGGGRFTYSSYAAFGDARAAPWAIQYIASRGAGGEWSTHGIDPPRGELIGGIGLGISDTPYRAFSEDLCTGWMNRDAEPPLTAGAPAGVVNVYRVGLCGPESYTALVPRAPEGPDSLLHPNFQGRSVDGAYAVFRAKAELELDRGPVAAGGGEFQCYGSDLSAPGAGGTGELVLVSVLPDREANPDNCSVGTSNRSPNQSRQESSRHAVSSDGSRIYWTATPPGGIGSSGPGDLYLRLNAFGPGPECKTPASRCTVALAPGLSQSRFWAARPDGGAALFTDGQINSDTGIGDLDLYRFDLASQESQKIAGGVRGLLGASEDLSRVYLVSTEDLDEGGPASAEEPNLYLYEEGAGEAEGSFRYIATLSAADARAETSSLNPGEKPGDLRLRGVPSTVNVNQRTRTAQVAPDGASVAFASTAPQGGHDNLDAASGEPDAEVFLYDAQARGGAGELRCVSCNPTGGRPQGRAVVETVSGDYWAAAQLPLPETQFHLPRALSPDGQRLFFESYEALVLGDTNGGRDVYQWEAPGKGSCTPSHRDFSAPAGGCVSLISSGQSPSDASFLDASPGGRDAFFKTEQGLLPRDPGLVDVYDARIEGGSREPDPESVCEGEACQSPPPAPEAPAPATAGHRGAGNLAPPRRSCRPAARRAAKVSRAAKRSRRRAARLAAKGHRGAARSARRAARKRSRRAKRLSTRVKRCPRARAAGRAAR